MSLRWVDPSEGWRWGFPKIYDEEKDGNLTEWLIKEGLPASELDYPMRFWNVMEVENAG